MGVRIPPPAVSLRLAGGGRFAREAMMMKSRTLWVLSVLVVLLTGAGSAVADEVWDLTTDYSEKKSQPQSGRRDLAVRSRGGIQ
ncbi:MAG: hypothetical protein HYX75_16760 [Acidobacteria bacterium]|nr:hypothetical protein [Acidobacteriota bacterium]